MKRTENPRITHIDDHRRGQAETDIEILAQRLEVGYQMIEQAIAEGRDVSTWEEHWLTLLHEYEAAFQERSRAA